MNFVSIEYLIFLILCVIIAKLLNEKFKYLFLLISSYIFYSFWDFRFLSLIIVSTLNDYFISKKIDSCQESLKRKLLLSCSIFINLSILFTFKYFNFFVDSFMRFGFFNNQLNAFNTLNIILPVGISFYTFQTISYTIDVYKKKIKPETNFIVFATFVCFFPQLVAGPIERAKNLIPQIKESKVLDKKLFKESIYLIFQGLVLKSVVADNLSKVVDNLYFEVSNTSSTYLFIGTLCFSAQIYCDFAGYSRIARGSAGLLGIKLSRNFDFPYLATSIQEFWRRWHITLSFWFRDYVYIPLGGSRKSFVRNVLNLVITMTVAGLWHGASWNFVLWGFLYGALLSTRYFKILNRLSFKDIFIFLLIIFFFYLNFIKPFTYNYFERYDVQITENSIYNYLNFPADGRCLNSIDDVIDLSIPDINIKYEYLPSSFKCHNSVMGVNSETLNSGSELIIYLGKNEILPNFITKKSGTILILIIFIFQKKFQFKFLKIISTFFIVNTLWIPFRIKGFDNINNFIVGLWTNNPIIGVPPTEHWNRLLSIDNSNYLSTFSSKFLFPLLVFLVIEVIDFMIKKYNKDFSSNYYPLVINFYFILIYLFSARTYSPFIYFQF